MNRCPRSPYFACLLLLCLCWITTAIAATPASISPKISELMHVHHAEQLLDWQLASAREAVISGLISKELATLDASSNLGDPQRKQLVARLRHDIRPIIDQAFQSASRQSLLALLEAALQQQLSSATVNQLLTYYTSPAGQLFLAFKRALNEIVCNGVIALTSAPFNYQRGENDAPALQDGRRQLIAMSSFAQWWHPGSNAQSAQLSSADSLTRDLLAMQAASALDRLGNRYRQSLPAFAAFEQSPIGRQETEAMRLWSLQLAKHLSPMIDAAGAQLNAMQPRWQQYAQQLFAGQP